MSLSSLKFLSKININSKTTEKTKSCKCNSNDNQGRPQTKFVISSNNCGGGDAKKKYLENLKKKEEIKEKAAALAQAAGGGLLDKLSLIGNAFRNLPPEERTTDADRQAAAHLVCFCWKNVNHDEEFLTGQCSRRC